MIIESGQVVKIDESAIWVETYQKSTCGKCAVQSGCGQGLLNKFGSRATQLKIQISENDRTKFTLGQTVNLGIAESAFISGVFFLYWIPLVFMLVGLVASKYAQLSDGQSAWVVVSSLLIGVYASRFYCRHSNTKKFEPVLIDL